MSEFRKSLPLWSALLAAAMVIGSTLWTHMGVVSHVDEIAGVHGDYLWSHRTGDRADLKAELDALRKLGVTSLRRFDADGDLVESAGEPVSSMARGEAGAQRLERGRYRMEFAEPSGVMVVEYEPLLVHDLHGRTVLGLVTAVLASILLVGSAGFWLRSQRRAETAEREAVKVHQLAQLGTMSSVVAHELRNPLSVLLGHAQLLREDLPNDPSVAHIESGALRLDALLDSLLHFARTGEVAPVSTDPVDLVVRAAADIGVDIVVRSLDVPHWLLDPMRMRQVLGNLLLNARAAAPEQSVEVDISVRDGALEIAVTDHGEGVPDGLKERVFEPFFTTRVQGTGLGLAVARDIVGKHGGTLTVKDAPSGGACFVVTVEA